MDDRSLEPSPTPAGGSETLPFRVRPRPFERVDIRVYVLWQVLLVSAVLAVAAHTLQGDIDVSISSLFFDAPGNTFDLSHSIWLEILGHQAARALPVIVGALALAAGVAGGFADSLRPWRRILFTLGVAVILGPAIISVLKSSTAAHCPHDLQMFGGVIEYARERASPIWAPSAAAAGHCLPSGHAGGGYALVALYFAGWAAGRPEWRWRGLWIGVGAGVLFSVVRVIQGAHFPSQTMWSATIDWCVASLLFMPLLSQWPNRAAPRSAVDKASASPSSRWPGPRP